VLLPSHGPHDRRKEDNSRPNSCAALYVISGAFTRQLGGDITGNEQAS
jgi:hypothetical protein